MNLHRFSPGILFLSAGLALSLCGPLQAGEPSHYLPGATPIRGWALGPPGLYYEQFNIYYRSSDYQNDAGIANPPRKSEQAGVSPTLVWVTQDPLWGAAFGLSGCICGDLLLQPLYLTWSGPRFDLTANYGLYVPTGAYQLNTTDVVGEGFWANQFQLSGSYYFDEAQASSLVLTLTYELNGQANDYDLTPGNHLTLEWGLDRYLTERFAVGLTGYGSWQVSDDRGVDALNPTVRDRVYAAGGELSYMIQKDRFFVFLRYLQEFAAQNRFEGGLTSLTLTYVF